MPERSVSVVIATFNRPVTITASARSVLNQLPPLGELLVIDQTSSYPDAVESSIREVERDERVRWIRGGPPSLPAARNFALETATAEVVIFFDDDVELLPGCIDAHLEIFERRRDVAGTCGRVLSPGTESRDVRTADNGPVQLRLGGWIRGSIESEEEGAVNALYGCNMAVRRGAARSVGGFDTGFVGNAFREDAEFSSRLASAGKLWFVPRATLVHLQEPTGGCRVDTGVEVDAVLYQNETRFFRSTRPKWLFPIWLMSLVRRYVVCGPAIRERRVFRTATALILGVSRGLLTPAADATQFSPRPVTAD